MQIRVRCQVCDEFCGEIVEPWPLSTHEVHCRKNHVTSLNVYDFTSIIGAGKAPSIGKADGATPSNRFAVGNISKSTPGVSPGGAPSASEAAKVNTPDVSPEKFIKNEWQICPVCESTDAFLCKAIPRKLFLSILIPMLIVAFVLLLKNWWWGFGFLVILLAIDLMLYRWLPNMLVCYGCQSEFRGFKIKDGLSFDHHVAERYRQRQAQ